MLASLQKLEVPMRSLVSICRWVFVSKNTLSSSPFEYFLVGAGVLVATLAAILTLVNPENLLVAKTFGEKILYLVSSYF